MKKINSVGILKYKIVENFILTYKVPLFLYVNIKNT